MKPGQWVETLRELASSGMDIVDVAEHMREGNTDFSVRSMECLNEFRVAFELSIRQMQDIGGWYEGTVSSAALREEIRISSNRPPSK
ncbi:hypothetical protein AB0B01_00125 [Streptomyces sp. NPDC044571]|uniref:hypothetical protein n=1 Tax=Streptomyces sp. NPDC044571 TaxID=3155371 RepID=UPI0033E103E0